MNHTCNCGKQDCHAEQLVERISIEYNVPQSAVLRAISMAHTAKETGLGIDPNVLVGAYLMGYRTALDQASAH